MQGPLHSAHTRSLTVCLIRFDGCEDINQLFVKQIQIGSTTEQIGWSTRQVR